MFRLTVVKEQGQSALMNTDCVEDVFDRLSRICRENGFQFREALRYFVVLVEKTSVLLNRAPTDAFRMAWQRRLQRIVNEVCRALETDVQDFAHDGPPTPEQCHRYRQRFERVMEPYRSRVLDLNEDAHIELEADKKIPGVEIALFSLLAGAASASVAGGVGLIAAAEAAAAFLISAFRDDIEQWLEQGMSPDDIASRIVDTPVGQEQLAKVQNQAAA